MLGWILDASEEVGAGTKKRNKRPQCWKERKKKEERKERKEKKEEKKERKKEGGRKISGITHSIKPSGGHATNCKRTKWGPAHSDSDDNGGLSVTKICTRLRRQGQSPGLRSEPPPQTTLSPSLSSDSFLLQRPMEACVCFSEVLRRKT
jgi:hypothetical protein